MRKCFSISFALFVKLELLTMVVLGAIEPLKISIPSTSQITPIAKKLPKILPPQDSLSFSYYLKTCPQLEAIVHQKVNASFIKDPTIAASIIRLHFHDCAVRGCDASILLNHQGSERRALASKTLRGFKVINQIKAEVEKKCPRIVSCADILTAAARDATVAAGGPFWEIPFGRKDGKISVAKEADMVPHGRESVDQLINFFNTLGLNMLDLVVLSGSHTIGRSSCSSIMHRLANFNGTRKPDPSLDVSILNKLKKKCIRGYNNVDLDVITPTTFDTIYYTNLENKKGLLSTDQALYSDQRTAQFVQDLATQDFLFSNQFAASMVKLGNVNVHVRTEGEIRINCNCVNRRG